MNITIIFEFISSSFVQKSEIISCLRSIAASIIRSVHVNRADCDIVILRESLVLVMESLPKEILEKVFHHLIAFQLTQARLVCREWNRTICESRELLDKFVFCVNNHGSCKKNCEHCAILVNARGRLINVKNRFSLIQDWSLIGDHIQRLTLECCYGIKIDRLVDLLRNVRSLHSLTLKTMFLDDCRLDTIKLDFRMKNLAELLLLEGQIPVKCLYIFKKICVRLEILHIEDTIHWKSNSDHWDDQLFNLIGAVRNTLVDLKIASRNIRDSILEDISSIDQLELKRISLPKCEKLNEQHIVSLTRMQPALEYLEVQSVKFRDEKLLIEVCQNLANLTCIKLETIHLSDTSWLSHLPNLVQLDLNNHGSHFDLHDSMFPNLQVLSLQRVLFPPGSIQKLFGNFPNLRKFTISSCELKNIPDLLASLHRLNHLEHLSLENLLSFVDRYPKIVHQKLTNLRRLELINLYYFPLHLFSNRCPNLQVLHLERTNSVDRQLQLACRALRNLKEISIKEMTNVTGSFVENICFHQRSLERIAVSQCSQIRYGYAKNRMNALRERVQVTCR